MQPAWNLRSVRQFECRLVVATDLGSSWSNQLSTPSRPQRIAARARHPPTPGAITKHRPQERRLLKSGEIEPIDHRSLLRLSLYSIEQSSNDRVRRGSLFRMPAESKRLGWLSRRAVRPAATWR